MSDTQVTGTTPEQQGNSAAVTGHEPAPQQAAPSNPDAWLSDWKGFAEYAKTQGYKPQDLMAAFQSRRQDAQTPAEKPSAPAQTFDGAKLLEQARAEIRKELVLNEHRQAQSAEEKSLNRLLEKVKTSPYTDEAKELLSDAIRGRIEAARLRSMYPDGHPLRDQYLKPIGEDVFGEVDKWYEKSSTAFKAAMLAKIGDAAKAQGRAPAAGNTEPQGKPKNEKKPSWDTSDDDAAAEEIVKKTRARFDGNALAGACALLTHRGGEHTNGTAF